MYRQIFVLVSVVLMAGSIPQADAATLPDILEHTTPWLFIGTGAPNDSTSPEGVFNKGVGDAVDMSNFEIGANKAPVPANQFGGISYNPGLQWMSNIPYIPGVVIGGVDIGAGPGGMTGRLPQEQVITYSGNVAVTHIDGTDPNGDKNGRFGASDMGVFAKNQADGGPVPDEFPSGAPLPAGIVTAGPANTNTSNGGTIQNNSNSFFNDEDYPNSILDQSPNVGDNAKKLAPGNGITGGVDFSDLRKALDSALVEIPLLPAAAPNFAKLELNNNDVFVDVLVGNKIDLSADGKIDAASVLDPTTLFVDLNHGLNVIDFDTGGNDLLLNNSNIIIDGFADSFVIFRVPTGSKFNIDNGNILVADEGNGIGLTNVMFFSDTPEQSEVFHFNNTLFNGIAFWTLGDGSGIHVNDSQGCVQMVGDKLNFQDIRYSRCQGHGDTVIPEPATLVIWSLLGVIGITCHWRRRRA